MNTKALGQVLTTHANGSEKAGEIEIGDETQVTFYANLGSESLTITAISAVKLMDDMVTLTTRKGEVFVLAAQDVRALRVGKADAQKRTGLIR